MKKTNLPSSPSQSDLIASEISGKYNLHNQEEMLDPIYDDEKTDVDKESIPNTIKTRPAPSPIPISNDIDEEAPDTWRDEFIAREPNQLLDAIDDDEDSAIKADVYKQIKEHFQNIKNEF
ncbi:hypothetical protein GF376_02905 [Candidatus Peregrinibacteria bacterium]|nr:hypothetical protein [Candidatus Peregrinibacteria bacterium]